MCPGAISYGYANIFVTAPSPENLKTVFEFVINGLKALKYTEHIDFEVSLCVADAAVVFMLPYPQG